MWKMLHVSRRERKYEPPEEKDKRYFKKNWTKLSEIKIIFKILNILDGINITLGTAKRRSADLRT